MRDGNTDRTFYSPKKTEFRIELKTLRFMGAEGEQKQNREAIFHELSSLLETLYLLRSPANATRLTTALERSKAGTIQPQALKELYKKFGLEENDTDN